MPRNWARFWSISWTRPWTWTWARWSRTAGNHPDSGNEHGGAEIRTFRQLLLHPHPPIEVLNLVKQFAKGCRSRPDGPLPHEVATILYLAAIAAARRNCHQRISTLDDAAWQRAVDWALAQTVAEYRNP